MTIHKNMIIGILLVMAFISCTGIFGVAVAKIFVVKQYSLLFAVTALYLSTAASLGFIVGVLGEKSPRV
jgi:hypothetical protein